MASGEKKIFVFLDGVFFLVGIEMVNLHAFASARAVGVLHGVGTPILKIKSQEIPSISKSCPSENPWRFLFTRHARSRGIQHIQSKPEPNYSYIFVVFAPKVFHVRVAGIWLTASAC